MKGRLAIVLVGVVASGALVFTGVAGAGGAAVTKITIRGPQGDFEGKILSASDTCLGDRRISVFMQTGQDQDPSVDERIASDTSEQQGDHGEWSVGNTGFRDGSFYARVARSAGCKAARSKTIELVDGVPQ